MPTTATRDEIEAGRGYENLFVPALFAPWPQHLLSGAEIREGDHVLDVACGTGVLAKAAAKRAGRAGRVTGLDPAPGMIEVARESAPEIEWVIGAAEALPFPESVFDRVVSQFGLMFFQDRATAVAEMFRVTKPGGRLALAAWHSIEQNPAYGEIVAILEKLVSAEAAETVRLPFCLGDPGQVKDLVFRAGYGDITVETHREQASFPSARTMVEVELRGWLPLFGNQLDEPKIADVLNRSEASLAKYTAPSGRAEFAATAYVVSARKP